MAGHVAATVDEIPTGSRKRVTIKGRDIVIFNLDGEFFALLDKCPHEGASLSCGVTVGLLESERPGHYTYSRQGEMVRCPWHGWEYDIRTGQSYCSPDDIKVKQFKVEVGSGEELAKGPYVAERFDVSVEQNYVVVNV
ncbi:Rieske (2Fe-2S) protein [Pelagibacterium sp.]|uniref:Rieske (2Fe-2S) protein n=1 Tax=Pelagibacterium sp. TaxID=1967288 RepID=UPI003C7C53AA